MTKNNFKVGDIVVGIPTVIENDVIDKLYGKASNNMEATQLLSLFDEFVKNNRDILERKGNDYSGNNDRLRNFKASEIVHVRPENGILVRIVDKLTRVSELLEHDSMVKSESILDTVSDMSNYAFLLYALLKSKETI